MSVEQNKASMYRCFEEVWNKGDLSVLPEVIAQDYIGRNPGSEVRGIDAFKQSIIAARNAFPDLHYTIDDVVGEGDKLAIRLTVQGTFKNKYGDTEPTGGPVKYTMALFNRYVDGKCVEAIPFADRATISQQLGTTPSE